MKLSIVVLVIRLAGSFHDASVSHRYKEVKIEIRQKIKTLFLDERSADDKSSPAKVFEKGNKI